MKRSSTRRLWARHMVIVLALVLSVVEQLPAFMARPLRERIERTAAETTSAWDGKEAGLLLLFAPRRGGQGKLRGTTPTAPGEFSPLNAPSTEVFNPDPTWSRFDLPEVFLDSRYDPAGVALEFGTDTTLAATDDETELQAVIDAWAEGTAHVRVKLPNGFVADQIRLKNNANGNYWLYIEWENIDSVQAEGVQADPTTVATTHANAPVIRSNDGFGEPAIRCDLSAHHVRMVGIHFRGEVQAQAVFNLVQMAGSVGSNDFSVVDEVSKCPRWMIIDRCWIDGEDRSNVRNGLQNDCAEFCMVDSVVEGGYLVGFESHGIFSVNGPGPHKYVGNAIEGGSINYLVGGVDPLIGGLTVSDVEVRRNYWFKRPSWNKNDSGNFDGVAGKVCKNIFELKYGRRFLLCGNVFDGNYHDGGQQGAFLVWKTENSNGGNTSAETHDITYCYNLAKNVSGGYEFIGLGDMTGGGPPNAPLYRVHHHDNLVYELGANIFAESDGGGGLINGKPLQHASGCNNIILDHDTIVTSQSRSTDSLAVPHLFTGVEEMSAVEITNTILAAPLANPDGRIILGSGDQTVSPDTGENTLDVYVSGSPGWTYRNNVVVCGSETIAAGMPSESVYPETVGDVGFENVAALNFRLSASSDFKGICDDGRDPGADVDLVELATSGVAP